MMAGIRIPTRILNRGKKVKIFIQRRIPDRTTGDRITVR
jgi:hypothetical protein